MIYSASITRREAIDIDRQDKRLIRQVALDIHRFDRIYSYYGGDARFDIPFLRTRALEWNLPFPLYGDLSHIDIYSIVKRKLCLHSRRQAVACKLVLGKTRKTELEPKIWQKGRLGYPDAIEYIMEHCEADVLDLQELTEHLLGFIKEAKTSI